MRIALIGAGGIGSFYVCRLMQAGHDVLAVARGAHLEAMHTHGLRVEHAEHPYEGPVAVGHADDVALSAADADAMFALIRNFPPIKTSMLVDFEHGRQLEIEALCGAVLRRAERHGIQVPCMSTIATLLAAKVGDGTLKP